MVNISFGIMTHLTYILYNHKEPIVVMTIASYHYIHTEQYVLPQTDLLIDLDLFDVKPSSIKVQNFLDYLFNYNYDCMLMVHISAVVMVTIII